MASGLTEDRYIKAIESKAGNAAVVHHLLTFAVDADDMGDSNGEHGSPLRLRRQRRRFEMVAAIEKKQRSESIGAEFPHACRLFAQDFGNPGIRKSLVGWKFLTHKRQCLRDGVQVATRHDAQVRIVISLQQLERGGAHQFAKVDADRMFRAGVIRTIQPPVPCDEVKPSIAVEISARDAVPPAGDLVDG